jgi:UDP-glucose 4-epimerase
LTNEEYKYSIVAKLMKILITGGAGFIGSHLGKYLVAKKHQVYLLDNLSYGFIDNFTDNKELVENFICMDIRDPKLEGVMQGIDIVFHLAGMASLPVCNDNPNEAYQVNVAGTANVLEMARRAEVKRVIFASTAAVYDCEPTAFPESTDVKPSLVYAQSKKAAEDVCQAFREMYGMDITIFRFFNVYGPNMVFRPPSYLISYVIGCLLKKQVPVLHSNGKQARDFVYVTDLIRLCEIVMDHPKAKNEVFNVATGKTISVQGIFDIIAKLLKEKKIKPTYRDPKLVWEKFPRQFGGKYPLNPKFLDQEVNRHTIASIEKTQKLLNWKPKVSIEEGLAKTVTYTLKKGLKTA